MKKRILLFVLGGSVAYLGLTSYSGGAAYNNINRTGSQLSVTNCGGSVGSTSCHGTGTSTTVTITLDSGSTLTPTSHYKPGMSYTLKIHGTNTSSLPKFGFEFSSVSGTGASQLQAGYVTSSSLPAHAYVDTLSGLYFFEHGSSFTGSPAGTYDISATWVAPATNVGNVTLYCTLNAVNGNTSADAADISGNTSVVLTPVNTTSEQVVGNEISIVAFPNPATDVVNISVQNANAGVYTFSVINLNGSMVATQEVIVNGATSTAAINTANWTPGLYTVVVSNNASRQTIAVVKQ